LAYGTLWNISLMFSKLRDFEIKESLIKGIVLSLIVISVYFIEISFDPVFVSIEAFPRILSNVSFDSINPQFSVSNNYIYATWVSNVNLLNSDVMFKRIDESSSLFSDIVNLSNTPGISNLIKLTSSENNVYIAWEEKQFGRWNLLFRKSEDHGKNFGNVIDLSNITGNVHLHDLIARGENVMVTWAANENTSSTNKDIFFRKSMNYGDSFDDTIDLSNNNNDSLDPHIVTNQDGSIIYIVWTECDIKLDEPKCAIEFSESLNHGDNFTFPRNLSNIMSYSISIRYAQFDKSIENRTSYAESQEISRNAKKQEEFNAINPTVFTTSEGKYVYVLWEQTQIGKGNSEIFLSVSNDFGESFGQAINISNSSGISRFGQGQIVNNDLYVVWSDTSYNYKNFDVMLRKIDASNKAGKVINISHNKGNSVSPFLLVSNNLIYVGWNDDTDTSSILLRRGAISGSFDTATKINIGTTGIYTDPLIFDAGNKIWVAWTEYNGIFHKLVLVDAK
jgi:hypothetical protein